MRSTSRRFAGWATGWRDVGPAQSPEPAQAEEVALRGEGGVTGDGWVTAVGGEAADADDLAVGAVEAVMVGELVDVAFAVGLEVAVAVGREVGFAGRLEFGFAVGLEVGLVVGPVDAVACGRPATVMAGRGSAFAGAPELRAAKPTAQVPMPTVPETAQAMVDFDNRISAPFPNVHANPAGRGRPARRDESPLIRVRR